jgi:hypothetical protein
MLRAFLIVLLLAVGAAQPAAAQSLDSMRASGAVGERYDGLLVARDPGAKGFVDQVNRQRLQIYRDRAAQQGVTPEQVGQVYAQQIIRNAPGGTWFLDRNGNWRK